MSGNSRADRESDGAAPRPISSRVERRRDRRKAEIVRTATEVLTANGYQSTNLEDVAERTDIAKATLYHYFASKDELVAAVLESLTQEVLSRLQARLDALGPASALERLRALVDEQIIILTDTAPEVATVFSWPKTWPDVLAAPMKQMRRRHDAVFRAVLADGLATGEFTCGNPDVALQNLHGILNQTSVWMRREDAPELREDVVTSALRLFTGRTPPARAGRSRRG